MVTVRYRLVEGRSQEFTKGVTNHRVWGWKSPAGSRGRIWKP